MNTRCNVRAAISIESILIGNSITLQLRLCEADVKPIKKEKKRLYYPVRKHLSRRIGWNMVKVSLMVLTLTEILLLTKFSH